MSGEQPTGQDAPVVANEATNPAAATDPAATTSAQTDGADGGEKESPVPKTYTEEELRDRIERATAKAAAKAERKALREAHQMLQRTTEPRQPAPQASDDRPRRDQFASEEDYFDKLTDWKLGQRDRAQAQEKQQEHVKSIEKKTERLYAEAEKIPGFDRDDFEALPLTPAIAQALADSDVAPKLMAHMASNPDDVERIAKLPAARQAAEIGKLEARLQSAPKTTNAPTPIEPVGTRGSGTTSLESADFAQYKKLRAKQGARWAS